MVNIEMDRSVSSNADELLDAIVIGAGLTGLSTAHYLHKSGKHFLLLEQNDRVGGQICTYEQEGFIFESGPNTGIISNPETAEFFDDFPHLLELALPQSKRRLILKEGKFHPLPSGLKSAITTSLFTWQDKLNVLIEPFRPKGKDPNESIASLVRRRLGESYLRYAVDPFVGGIYAGDAESLVVRYALPKLYALEERYGSFVKGAIALMRRPKDIRSLRATKEIFSVRGGLSCLTEAIAQTLREKDRLVLKAKDIRAEQLLDKTWRITYIRESKSFEVRTKHLISTVSPLELQTLLTPLKDTRIAGLCTMPYAPIVQLALGYRTAPPIDFDAFGGLIPSSEHSKVLGIMNISSCFDGRCPPGGMLLSVFMGGRRCPEVIDRTDEELKAMVLGLLSRIMNLEQEPDLCRIFRHRQAIPQYERDMTERLNLIEELKEDYPTLHIGGSMHEGIGMPDRIKQGRRLAKQVLC